MPPRHTAPFPAPSAGAGPSNSRATTASRTRRASQIKESDVKRSEAVKAEGLEVEDFGPPEWRTVLNSRADLGYPDFYPSRPGFHQPEDVLTEENVKNGFVAKTFVTVGAESFSMHGPIHQYLLNGGMEMIMKMGQSIIEKRDESMPQLADRTFRIPPRVTYNDIQRVQFFADLANPAVPLHRMAREGKAPRDFKGLELLDTMFARVTPTRPGTAAPLPTPAQSEPIPVERALWFIRVLGSHEIVAHRQRIQAMPATAASSPMPNTPNSSAPGAVTAPAVLSSNDWYTQEFTGLYTSWLRTQMGHLVLPAKGVQPQKAATGVLGDEKSRAKWLAKWSYSTSLLRELHTRRLVSTRALMGWLADFLRTANLAQAGFIAQLVGDYLPDMLNHLPSSRICVRGVCDKIQEIKASPAAASLAKVQTMLEHIAKTLIKGNPDVLLSPTTWRQHSELLSGLTTPEVYTEMASRNTALLYVPATCSTSSPRRHQIEEISKLDSISAETNMTDLCKSFFDGNSSPTSPSLDLAKFEDKVFILLNWAMGLRHLGIHRPYGCHTMLRLWTEQRAEYLGRPFDIFPQLYNWLDTSPAAKKERNIQAIGITFGEFTRQGMFSYSQYLHILIARGYTARSRPNGPRSHHMDLLRSMPIFVVARDLLQQRRIALSGDEADVRAKDDADEEVAMEAFKEECKEYVPELYGFKRYGRSAAFRDDVDHAMPSTEDITRFIFLQARFELAAESQRRLKRQGKTPSMSPSTFARVIHILHMCKGYSSIADFVVRAIRINDNQEILRISIDILRCHADVWTAMDRWPVIVDALMERFHRLDRKDIYHPRLPRLIIDLAGQGRAREEDAEEVRSYVEYHEKAWYASMGKPSDSSSSMPELRQAFLSSDLDKAQTLGQALYDRHGPYYGWAPVWWGTIIDVLRTLSIASEGTAGILDVVAAHVDQVTGFAGFTTDLVVAEWLEANLGRYDLFSAVSPIRQLFLMLVTRRRLATLTLLDKYIYPLWKQFSAILLSSRPQLSPAQLQAIDTTVILVQQLLLSKPPNPAISPIGPQEAFIAYTSRSQVFANAHMPVLIRHLPYLVVLGSISVPQRTKDQIRLFFADLATIPEFKTAAFRHLTLLKDAFLSSDWGKADPAVEAGMIDTLKDIMSEGPPSKASATMPSLQPGARLSAWRWTSVVLEMRVEFKRLAMRIHEPGARETLKKLVGESMNREHSPDDAELLCEAFKGIDAVVVSEIIAVGLDRLGVLLGRVEEGEEVGRAIDEVLRIVCSAGTQGVITDKEVLFARFRLLDGVGAVSVAVGEQLGAGEEVGPVLRSALKVLRFALGLDVDPASNTAPRPDFVKLVLGLLRILTLVNGSDAAQIQDILVYVIDSVPPPLRAALHLALVAEASTPSIQTALQSIPALADILPHSSPPRRYMTLTTTTDDSTSSYTLDDRPWELFEYMAPVPPRRKHADQFLAIRPYQDTASIPAALFDPLVRRDALPTSTPHAEGDARWKDLASERNLGNGLAGEPIAAKQLATLLYAGPASAEPQPLVGLGIGTDPHAPDTHSPAMGRRMSTRIATSSSSKTKAAGTDRDPISIDDDDDGDSDSSDEDDLEILQPAAKRARTGSKSVAGAAGGSGAGGQGRAAVGGKMPAGARKTVGGKSVGGKSVAGKSVGGKGVGRKTAGKGVKRR